MSRIRPSIFYKLRSKKEEHPFKFIEGKHPNIWKAKPIRFTEEQIRRKHKLKTDQAYLEFMFGINDKSKERGLEVAMGIVGEGQYITDYWLYYLFEYQSTKAYEKNTGKKIEMYVPFYSKYEWNIPKCSLKQMIDYQKWMLEWSKGKEYIKNEHKFFMNERRLYACSKYVKQHEGKDYAETFMKLSKYIRGNMKEKHYGDEYHTFKKWADNFARQMMLVFYGYYVLDPETTTFKHFKTKKKLSRQNNQIVETWRKCFKITAKQMQETKNRLQRK